MADDLDNILASLRLSPTGPSSPATRGAEAPSSQSAAPAPQGEQPRGGAAPQKFDAGQAGVLGFGDSASFGFLDEAGAVVDSLGGTSGRENVWNSKKSFGDLFASNVAKNRAILQGAQQQHSGAYLAGQVGGALAVPVGAAEHGALSVAKAGALQGAAYGLGSGEGTQDRVTKAGEYGLAGAVIAPVVGRVAGAVGSVVKKGVQKVLGREAPTAAAEAAPAVEHTVEGWTEPNLQGERQPIVSEQPTASATAPQEEMIPLHAPTEEPVLNDGEVAPKGDIPQGEAIGSISRSGLQDLQGQVEQFRAGIAKGGDRAVDVTPASPEHPSIGAFRLGNLGDGPDTASLLGALVRQLPSKVGKTDAELMATAKAASDGIGAQDPEAVYALAKEIAGPLGDADTSMAVLRTVTQRAHGDIDLFHNAGVDWSTASDEMVQQAGQKLYNAQRLNSLLMSAKVGVGRGLRVNQLPDADTYLKALAKGENLFGETPERTLPPLPTSRQEMSDWFDLWGMSKNNPEQQHDLLAGTLSIPTASHYLQHSFANMFTASILSMPKTLALNIVGPVVINTLRSLERMGGGALGALDPTVTAAERAAAAEVAKQTPIALFHTLGDIADVFRHGVQAFTENHPVLGGGGSVKDANITFGPFNSNLLHTANVDPDWRYSLGNALNIFPKALSRVNAGLDEMAKRFSYLNEVRLTAQVEAAGKGLVGEDAHSYVSQVMKSSVDEAGKATNDALLRSAERTTLTGAPGAEDSLSRKFATFIQTLRKDYPVTRYILPVYTVPANAIGETMRRIPLYNRMPWLEEHAADLAGDNGAVAQAEAHGRTLLGASFLTGAYLLNQAGLLTGSGPKDPTDNRIWRQTHEPYSIRIGDQWVSYRKLDILGGLLAIPATVSDASVYHRVDDRSMGDMALVAAGSLATWFKDQGAMRMATQLITWGDDPVTDPAKAFENVFGNIAAGMIPASGAIRSLTVDTTDPYTRMKKDWTDYIKAGIPGLSEDLEPLRNVLGEPVNRPSNTLAESIIPVTLAPVATYTKEPVLDELTRLYRATGYGAGADPKTWLYGYGDPQTLKLEDGKSLYFHAMQARATMKLDGQTLKQALGDLIQSDEYNQAVDADSSQRYTSQGDESRGYMVASLFNQYNKAIKAELADSSPTALKYLTAAAAKQRDDAYLGNTSLEQLVKNPDLYTAHGVDPTAYSDKITEGAAGDLLQALSQ